MKTKEKILMKADGLKTCGNLMGKAGYGMRLAALLGYKVGYNIAKHPGLDKLRKEIQHHPKPALIGAAGIGLGVLGVTGYLLRDKF